MIGFYGFRSIITKIADIKLLVKNNFWLLHEKGILTLLDTRYSSSKHHPPMLGGNQKVQKN